MKEKTLIAAIVRPLPPEIHSQSMTFGSLTANGTPDRYFDGTKGDLWCEFKQLDAWPRDGMVGGVDAKKRGCYSPQQYAWMKRRWENGRNVWGVIGCPTAAWFFSCPRMSGCTSHRSTVPSPGASW